MLLKGKNHLNISNSKDFVRSSVYKLLTSYFAYQKIYQSNFHVYQTGIIWSILLGSGHAHTLKGKVREMYP